jgi:methionine-rich copper-binding protein CopC
MTMTRIGLPLRFFLILIATVAALGLYSSLAQADELLESEPHENETLNHSPESIILTFDEPLLLEPGVNSVAIVNEEGERIDDGQAQISTYSKRTLVVRPAPGYEIEGDVGVYYSVTFESGATLVNAMDFTVDLGFEPPVLKIDRRSPPRSSESIVLWTFVILAAVALFTTLGYYLRFATDNSRSSVDLPEEDH